MKIRRVGAELFHADVQKDTEIDVRTDGRTDGRPDRQRDIHDEANSLFRNFANALKENVDC